MPSVQIVTFVFACIWCCSFKYMEQGWTLNENGVIMCICPSSARALQHHVSGSCLSQLS